MATSFQTFALPKIRLPKRPAFRVDRLWQDIEHHVQTFVFAKGTWHETENHLPARNGPWEKTSLTTRNPSTPSGDSNLATLWRVVTSYSKRSLKPKRLQIGYTAQLKKNSLWTLELQIQGWAVWGQMPRFKPIEGFGYHCVVWWCKVGTWAQAAWRRHTACMSAEICTNHVVGPKLHHVQRELSWVCLTCTLGSRTCAGPATAQAGFHRTSSTQPHATDSGFKGKATWPFTVSWCYCLGNYTNTY
jgi:hypothetical protein